MTVTVEKLEAARQVTVRVIQAREDRAKFVPISLELERQIATQDGLSERLARILGEAAWAAAGGLTLCLRSRDMAGKPDG